MTQALLFDLDGTLLMSDPIHEQIFRGLFADRGIAIDDAFYGRHVHGRLNVDVFAEFLPDEADPQGLSEWKEAEFRRLLPRPYPALPGVVPFIEDALARGWQVALVTNAMRANADAMLAAIGLSHAFETLVIGEECSNGKPHPEPYQTAMAALDVAPSNCIAFEDSPTGLASARAAGARVVGVGSTLAADALFTAGAHVTITDFTDPALATELARHTGASA